MKKFIKNLFLLAELSVGLGTMQDRLATAQTFTTTFTILHSFTGGSDGAEPFAGLILSGNTFYGTTYSGGGSNCGTVFAVNTNGSMFTVLHTFTGGSNGAGPLAGLILSGNTLYGTASRGGSWGYGTVFAVNTNGTSFTNVHSFDGFGEGAFPWAGLILSSNTLYGTVPFSGTGNEGTVFAVNTNGTGFTTLHSFSADALRGAPTAGLILVGNILYGTTESNVGANSGTVFAINTNGTGFTTLHSFNGSDGAYPLFARLVLLGSTLYGTAERGGSWGNGTVFALNTDGTGFTVLHSFSAGGGGHLPFINSDGGWPTSDLILSGTTLYGTATSGGSLGNGTVFSVKTDGTDFKTLYNFTGGTNGGGPNAGLIISGNTLYGTSQLGGSWSQGMLFSLALTPVSAPQISSQPLSRTNIAGSTATFSVLATGTAPLSYQWLKATNAIAQQRGSTLTLTNVSSADAASYSVIVSNAGGSVTSAPAILTVIARPKLTLTASTAHAVLTWSTSAGGFTLESTTNLRSSAIWTTVSPVPVIVNGQNVVTNPISGKQEFFRLSQ